MNTKENIPGSIEIFAKALGMSEAKMFKQMEQGKILAEDVLPKVAKEYARVARQNGALEKAQQKVNSQYQRFLNALTDIKIAMFEGGMGKSLAESFKIMSVFLQDNKEGFATLGKVIGSSIKTVVAMLNVALQPIMLLVKSFNALFGDRGAAILGTIAAIASLTRVVSLLAVGFSLANMGFMSLVKNIAKYGIITTAALTVEDLYVGTHGGSAISKDIGATSMLDRMAASSIGQIVTSPVRVARSLSQGNNPFSLEVKVNDGEFAKAIDVRVKQSDEDTRANVLAGTGG